ncbi:MAG: hypothetical protein IPO91_30320 [Chloroflexi bacterium]|nr:hypothetical protein [Chloroflexota bacterium]
MPDLQQRIDELRQAVQNLPPDAEAGAITDLERRARALLSDAKNTPLESAAQGLFAELARLSSPTSPVAATVRGLIRRARIRIEIAGDDDDVDEAIDILAEALGLNPLDGDVIALLEDAGRHSAQAQQRVNDLFVRHGVVRTPPPPPAPVNAPPTPSRPVIQTQEEMPRIPTGNSGNTASIVPPPRATGTMPPASSEPRRLSSAPSGDVDSLLSEMTQAYYAGDYQIVVDLANKVLSFQAGNPTASEYRQKAEDNLIRGVVPDHRIPFDARVSYNRANSLVRAGNYDEAERLYREARDLAERAGILSWKDAEQALLDIQDLALAREMINEGDRLMANDQWNEALRKYEGALRVVANDPSAEERIDKIRRIQGDTEGANAQLSMLGGSLSDQVAQLQNIINIVARLRQLLPNSARLQALSQETNNRLNGLKSQIHDQANSALNRASSASTVEERLALTNEALTLLDLGAKLDPSDQTMGEMLSTARASAADMQRARQVVERAAQHIAQNYDNELLQARSMLSSLMNYAQDSRYRAVVNDLLTRYIERAVAAVEDGDIEEAQALLQTMRDEPFNILGRRSEVNRIESQIRALRQRHQLRLAGIGGVAIIIILLMAWFTRPTWEAVFFPSPTPTATATFTPSSTPTASPTPTASDTPTSTFTPSSTPTASDTPTSTYTATATFTATDTPSVTPTPRYICRGFAVQNTNLRTTPDLAANPFAQIPASTVISILGQERDAGGNLWFKVNVDVQGTLVQNVYIPAERVMQLQGETCPAFP